MRGVLVVACGVMACATPDQEPATGPCGTKLAVVAGGSVEVGLATPNFTPITDGESVQIQYDPQNLALIAITARTSDLDVGSGALQGIVDAAAIENGSDVGLITTCRTETFVPSAGYLELAAPYGLPIDPSLEPSPVGKTFTIHLIVHDVLGHMATDSHTVTLTD